MRTMQNHSSEFSRAFVSPVTMAYFASIDPFLVYHDTRLIGDWKPGERSRAELVRCKKGIGYFRATSDLSGPFRRDV